MDHAVRGASHEHTRKLVAAPPLGTSRFQLVLAFRDPLTIGERRNSSNIYTTSDVVPGGAIKGALANLIMASDGVRGSGLQTSNLYPDLARNFSALQITHLFPAAKDALRPRVWPRSLVAIDKATLFDVALIDRAAVGAKGAPAFSPDWKGETYGVADERVGWPDVPRRLIVRTAVDPDKLSAATSQLYAQEQCEVGEHVWVGQVDLSDVPEGVREKVADQFCAVISNGLPGVGRSQSLATMANPATASTPSIKWSPDEDGCIVLTLQTSALLRSPASDYSTAITELSNGTLAYVRHFARERLSGADFMDRRYFKGQIYRPWLLTEAGSVFVVRPAEGQGDEAAAFIRRWLDHGLPLPQSVKSFYGLETGATDAALWQKCPYIAQNGYGEIAADMHEHRALKFEAYVDGPDHSRLP
jgi:hypothetical protein